MKKCVLLLLVVLFIFTFIGCQTTSVSNELPSVSVNMPTDNSVNGYRSEVSDTTASDQDTSLLYCGNISSKIFHKSTCSSVSRMKESNKLYSSGREWFINENYSPCKACNP